MAGLGNGLLGRLVGVAAVEGVVVLAAVLALEFVLSVKVPGVLCDGVLDATLLKSEENASVRTVLAGAWLAGWLAIA